MKQRLFEQLIRGPVVSSLCSAEGGGDDGGGGGGDDQRFTQDDVNTMIAKERKSWESKSKKQLDEATSKAQEQVDEVKAELEELRKKHEEATLDADQREKAALERAQKAIEKKLEDQQAKLTEAEKRAQLADQVLATERRARHLGRALTEAKAYPEALGDALSVFQAAAEVELDDKGDIVSVKYNEGEYTDIKEAAKAFLNDRPHFAQAEGGGAGTRTPTGSRGGSKVPLWQLSDEERWKLVQEK